MDLNKDFKDIDVKNINVKSVDLSGLKDFVLNFFIPLISLIGTSLLLFFVLFPSYRSIPDLETTLDQKTMLANRLQDKVEALNLLVDLEVQVEENSELVNKTLVSDVLVPELLAQIDRMAQESSMAVTNLGYSKGSEVSGDSENVDFSTILVSLGVEADNLALLKFLQKVEDASRLILVEDFRYSEASKKDAKDYGVNFKLNSPYLEVETDAVTDESIELDITDPAFKSVLKKLESLTYYEISPEDYILDVEESSESEEPSEEEEGPAEGDGDSSPF